MSRRQKPVVIAGTHQQYKSWCWENGMGVHDAVYISQPDRLRGLSLTEADIRFVGNYYERKDFHEIQDNLELCYLRGGESLRPVQSTPEREKKNLIVLVTAKLEAMSLAEVHDVMRTISMRELQEGRIARAKVKAHEERLKREEEEGAPFAHDNHVHVSLEADVRLWGDKPLRGPTHEVAFMDEAQNLHQLGVDTMDGITKAFKEAGAKARALHPPVRNTQVEGTFVDPFASAREFGLLTEEMQKPVRDAARPHYASIEEFVDGDDD